MNIPEGPNPHWIPFPITIFLRPSPIYTLLLHLLLLLLILLLRLPLLLFLLLLLLLIIIIIIIIIVVVIIIVIIIYILPPATSSHPFNGCQNALLQGSTEPTKRKTPRQGWKPLPY